MPVRLWTTTKIGKIASLPNSVKAVLSENKQVISVAFTALIQTLTSDPQMINIIYKILTANDPTIICFSYWKICWIIKAVIKLEK